MIPFDFHSHSNLSPDGDNTPEQMAEQAIKLGMKHYSLTDHLEINKFYDEEYLYEEPVRQASLIMPELKEKYKEKITLLYGVELGQPLHDMPLTGRVLSTYNYDFIIGSCHMVKGWDDFYYLDYKKVDPCYLLGLYFDEILEMAEWGKFDVLGHLTYPLRYITGDFGIEIDMSRYDSIIKKIFETLAKNELGMEINTSGLRQNFGKTFPDAKYIKMFFDAGGRILSIGSDSHCVADLGKGIQEGIALAREIGFKEVAFFKNRTPAFIGI